MSAIGRHVSKLSGYAPALPTPFDKDGKVDLGAFERCCDSQVRHGATALIVCGTTGEAPTLIHQERDELIRIAAGVSRGRVPVIAGAGSNATSRAVELTKQAEAAGADAILSVAPYYNKPTQRGLYAHFAEIAAATRLPIILYDVPSRTACAIADDTVARLAEMPHVIGLKDATADVARPARLRRLLGADFRLLSGDDATALAFLAQGGNGCISVTSNLAPGLCLSMFLAHRQGQIAMAQRLAGLAVQLTGVLFRETSPAPLKFALSLFGLMEPSVRLPLVEPTDQARGEITTAVADIYQKHPEYLVGRIDRFSVAYQLAG